MAPIIHHVDRRLVQHWIQAVRQQDEPKAYRPAMMTTVLYTFEMISSILRKFIDIIQMKQKQLF